MFNPTRPDIGISIQPPESEAERALKQEGIRREDPRMRILRIMQSGQFEDKGRDVADLKARIQSIRVKTGEMGKQASDAAGVVKARAKEMLFGNQTGENISLSDLSKAVALRVREKLRQLGVVGIFLGDEEKGKRVDTALHTMTTLFTSQMSPNTPRQAIPAPIR